jgi:hypothetical protein
MIDRITVQGTLKTLELGDLKRSAQVVLAQTSTTKIKPGAEYVPSPLSGSQIEMTLVQNYGSRELLTARFQLPLASAALGQNYIHDWVENLHGELRVASRLLRFTLEKYPYLFEPSEVDRFIQTAEVLSTEWTWHIECSSYRAAKNLLTRVYRQIKVLQAHNSRHDVGVKGYSFDDRNQRDSLKVYLKNGSEMKFYVKVDEMSDRNHRKRRGKALHDEHFADPSAIREAICTHLRVEAIPGRTHLQEHGMSNPGDWTAEGMQVVVDEVLKLAGFDKPYVNKPQKVDVSDCATPVQKMFARYREGKGMGKLSPPTVTRHRNVLLAFGIDIAIPLSDHQHLSGSIGQQLHYKNRWKAPAPLRSYMMSEITLPVLEDALDQKILEGRLAYPPDRRLLMEQERFRAAVPGRTRSKA